MCLQPVSATTITYHYIVVIDSIGVASTNLMLLALKSNTSVIMQNNGHYSIQDHLMLPISTPVESPYATSN